MLCMTEENIIDRLVREGRGVSLTEGSFCPVHDEENEPVKRVRSRPPRPEKPISDLDTASIAKAIRDAVVSVGNYSSHVEWDDDIMIITVYGLSESNAQRLLQRSIRYDEQLQSLSKSAFQDIVMRLIGDSTFRRTDDLGSNQNKRSFTMLARTMMVDMGDYVVRTEWKHDDDEYLQMDYFYHGTKIPSKVDTRTIPTTDLETFMNSKTAARKLLQNTRMIDSLDERRRAIKERESYIRERNKLVDNDFVEYFTKKFISELLKGYVIRTQWMRRKVMVWVTRSDINDLVKREMDVDVLRVRLYDEKSMHFRPSFEIDIEMTPTLSNTNRAAAETLISADIRRQIEQY